MATVDLTMDSFSETISKEGIVLIDFWADWCAPCRMFGPVYDKVSEEYEDITFGKVDTQAEQQLAGMIGISSIPTVMAFRDGIAVFRTSGALPETALHDVIKQIQELNMDEVRAEVAKQQEEGN